MKKSNPHELEYFSQHGEDYLLWKYFNYKPDGFFIEIGAFDGKYLSTTYSFEKAGWTGLCIEANPKYAELCKENRPGSQTLNIACSSEKKSGINLNTDPTGLFSGITTDAEQRAHVQDILKKKGVDFTEYDTIVIETDTLTNILENSDNSNRDIDFISIDVEGHELEVLQGIDFSALKPQVIFVEANSDNKEKEITDYLLMNNYIYSRRAGVNLFFARDPKTAKELKDINIFCTIEKQQHPIDASYSVNNIKNGLNIDEEKSATITSLDETVRKLKDMEDYLRKHNIELKETIKNLQIKNGQLNGELDWYKIERENKLTTKIAARLKKKKKD